MAEAPPGTGEESAVLTIEFDRKEYERLQSVTDDPAGLVREATLHRVEVEEAVAFTR